MSGCDTSTASIVDATLQKQNQQMRFFIEREREDEERDCMVLGERLEESGVEVVVPATVDEEVEAVDGD